MTKPGFTKRHENVQWRTTTTREAWTQDQVATVQATIGHEPSPEELRYFYAPDTLVVDGNVLTTAGVTRIMANLILAGAQPLDSTHSLLGVSDNTAGTTEAASNTDLGSTSHTNQYWAVPSTPTVAAGVLTVVASFGSSFANYAWADWGIAITTSTAVATSGAIPAGILLNRRVASLGTKSGGVWQLTVTITLS